MDRKGNWDKLDHKMKELNLNEGQIDQIKKEIKTKEAE